MNEYIKANPNESEAFYNSRLHSIRFDLNTMQDQYDAETDHSLIQDQQRLWEFKIDSLITRHTKDSGWVSDYYSGATIFFPASPEFQKGLSNTQTPYRFFSLRNYDMELSLASYQYGAFDVVSFESNLRSFHSDLSPDVKSFVTDTSLYKFKATVISKDSLQATVHNIWIYNGSYVYKLSASYPADRADTLGYCKIADSFLTSFSVHDTDNYWIEKFDKSKSIPDHGTLTTIPRNVVTAPTHRCIRYGPPTQNGFFRGPMREADGGLFIAYDIIKHDRAPIHKTTLIIKNDIYNFEPDSTDHLFFVPADALPKRSFEIFFGYQLAQDSTNDCYTLHHQKLVVNPYNVNFSSMKGSGH